MSSSLQVAAAATAATTKQKGAFESSFRVGLDLSEFGGSVVCSSSSPSSSWPTTTTTTTTTTFCASAQLLHEKQIEARENQREDDRMDQMIQARALHLQDALATLHSSSSSSSTGVSPPPRAAHPMDDPHNAHGLVVSTDLSSTLCSMHRDDDKGGKKTSKHVHSFSKMKPRATTTANRKGYSDDKKAVKTQQKKLMNAVKAKNKTKKHVRTGWKGKPLGNKKF